MSTAEILDKLRSRILSRFTLLFLTTWEEERWEQAIASLAAEIGRRLVVWSVTDGAKPTLDATNGRLTDPLEFLGQVGNYPSGHLFLLKDFHPYLHDTTIVRKLRDLATTLAQENKTLLFIGPDTAIPVELQKEAIKTELPLPGMDELRLELQDVLKERRARSRAELIITDEQEDRLLKAVLGLTTREARKALARGLLDCDTIDQSVYSLLVSEKKQMVQGSDLLEFYELAEGVDDVGGLDALKDWLRTRAEAFSSRAQKLGIPAPKGVLLLGVQGCGKSLTARAAARLLSFPLIRLDVSSLLSADQGASEKNMRNVLNLMETIAPAVLWLDEIEKGFAGGSESSSGQDATMTRLVGRFLTWMQENPAPVFVMATANSVSGLPPEMLRRGRFDELFFVDLPNYHERKSIFAIHLTKRGWKPDDFDIATLAERTEGYSGAEIEQIVLSAMVETFGAGASLTNEFLEKARDETVPLSVTMEEKIFQLREWARGRCRPATPDSRVLQMLEAEQREQGRGADAAFDHEEPQADLKFAADEWVELAEGGDISAAILEFVRSRDRTTFADLLEAFAEYTETAGDQGLALRSDPHVVLWVGMSQDFAGTLSKLISSKSLFVQPACGEFDESSQPASRLPLLDELPDNRISRPCWLPTVLTDVAPPNADERLARVGRMKLSK